MSKRDKMCGTCPYRNGAKAGSDSHPCHEEAIGPDGVMGRHDIGCFGSIEGRAISYPTPRFAQFWAEQGALKARCVGKAVRDYQDSITSKSPSHKQKEA